MDNMKTLDELLPDRSKMLDTSGRPITQSLFLEVNYTDSAIYTLKEDHFEYEGKFLPSLKKIYLEVADPTEYEFATRYLLGWKHWMRICDNKLIRKHIDEWRFELEYKLRSQGVKAAISQATTGSFQAAKWLADRGWESRGAGRPTKADVDREKKIQTSISEEYSGDIVRLANYK